MTSKKQETIETYNKSATAMAKKFNNLGARVEDIERLFDFIKKENPFILEIGCGNGREAKEVLRRTKNYLGIDVSEGFVNVARKHVPEGRFEIVDVENYSFPLGVDAIVSFASLLHSDKGSVEGVLSRAHRVLPSGGIFYISLKKGKYPEGGFTRTDEFGTRTYYFYTPELIEELAGGDYEVIFVDEQNLRGQEWFTIVLKKGVLE